MRCIRALTCPDLHASKCVGLGSKSFGLGLETRTFKPEVKDDISCENLSTQIFCNIQISCPFRKFLALLNELDVHPN